MNVRRSVTLGAPLNHKDYPGMLTDRGSMTGRDFDNGDFDAVATST